MEFDLNFLSPGHAGKSGLVAVLWLGSVMLVTSSASVMDAISDGMRACEYSDALRSTES